ncbi:hypothetical protein O4O00_23445 [Citrobacter sedlakii]|uniref:hypothetical protein n=1 Tax=Citrobacter sedlakii TaxID=67826 RepID=UPI000FC056A5|nr:hypothetical protein [Citrobacter sedlakii]EFM0752304.1 hypothetical protein [Salmonella enterica subsp. enterica serovar Bredeney]EHS1318921.1 hypothetical protein [Salmonella enterica subsp. enterica serovar Reading]MJU56994.1 hypothetical protein [Salmonella enterica subsp. enterica serovar Montevideo]MCZ4677291.1 hypothetical protein [Citrobacter sedlakii]MDR5007348.1 hypothetical protein [Citrobacter sedlakii]
MKRMQKTVMVPFLTATLLAVPVYGAEPVSPWFPDTELPSPGHEPDVLSRQGQVYVSGTLLVSPCVLSDWAEEIQGQTWVNRNVRQVTLALEGCGDGTVHAGPQQNAPLPVRGAWGDGAEAFALRLNDGVNYLTFPLSPDAGLVPLEMRYE